MDELCEAHMDNWFSQFNVTKVAGACRSGVAAGLALLAGLESS